MEIISIEDDIGKVYEFEKPEFDCELLKVIDVHWCVFIVKNESTKVLKINLNNGECYDNIDFIEDYCLTHIKPKWFEDESNFPVLMIGESYNKCRIARSKWDYLDDVGDDYRLATKKEIQNLQWVEEYEDIN